MTDLGRLIEAVEGVERGGAVWLDRALGPISGDLGLRAYRGSLDAAVLLLDALLPGWGWSLHDDGEAVAYPPGGRQKAFRAEIEGNPARALLLAVLKAYRETRG